MNEWYLNGTQVGEWTSSRNMSYAKVSPPRRIWTLAHTQVFDSSHMVGFDVPHVTNDMITRFMGVDLTLLPGVLGSTTGKLGGVNKVALSTEAGQPAGLPLFKGGKSDVESRSTVR